MPQGLWLYSYLGLWALLILTSLLLFAVVRQLRALHSFWVQNDPEWGLPLGALAPAVAGGDVFGNPATLGTARGKKTLILFLSRGCKACRQVVLMVPTLTRWEQTELLLVVGGSALDARLYMAEHHREERFPSVPVLCDRDYGLMEKYKVSAVPYVVVVDEDGRVGAKGSPLASAEIAMLLRQSDELRRKRQEAAPRPGVGFISAERLVPREAESEVAVSAR